jgi:hypothetical protein
LARRGAQTEGRPAARGRYRSAEFPVGLIGCRPQHPPSRRCLVAISPKMDPLCSL